MERQVRILADGVRAILLHPRFPHNFWPLAATYFCSALDTSEANGVSPYKKAHRINYAGLQVPFGTLVYFRPMDLGKKSKFVPRLHTGAFVGWHIQPCMNATSDYLSIAVEDLHRKAKGEIKPLPVHRVREVHVLRNPHFPFEEYAWSREADPTTRNHEDADEVDPHIMVGDDDDSDAEDAEKSDLPRLADAPLELTYIPGKAASSSDIRLEPETSEDSQSSSRGVKRKLFSDECFPTDEQLVEAARHQDEEMYLAVLVKTDERRATRIAFEFCCSEDSLMAERSRLCPKYFTDTSFFMRASTPCTG